MRARIAIVLTALALPRTRISPAFFCALLASLPAAASAATWVVDRNAPSDATSIQAGIDLASPGDSVLVQYGRYADFTLTKGDLTIVGAYGPAYTIVDADARNACVRIAANVANAVLSGFQFESVRGGYAYGGFPSYGVELRGEARIQDCILADNGCSAGAPVIGEGNLTITNTVFSDNVAFVEPPTTPSMAPACIRWTGRVDIDGCRFERNLGARAAGIAAATGPVTIRHSVFVDNEIGSESGAMFISVGASWLLEGNLFFQNHAALFAPGYIPLELRHNTFAANELPGSSYAIPAAAGSVISENVFTGSSVGLHLPIGGGGILVECNDSWGNEVDWPGHVPTGYGGNVSLPPLYCDPANGVFTVAGNSPLLPANNACGLTIGAFGAGCGAVSIEPMSWGAIKAQYR